MKKLIYIFICIICAGGISLMAGVLFLRHVHGRKMNNESGTVYIKETLNGYEIIRNGKPFYIKGAAGYSHFKELAESGGNTIRVYDTINIAHILDEAHANNLAAIVDIPLPPFSKMYDSYADKEDIIVLKQRVKELVKKNKDHPSLLMWNLGNELHYPFRLRKNTFMKTFNELIEIIKEEDPNHPVSTAATLGRKHVASLLFHSPKLDAVGINTFGMIKVFHPRINSISFIFGEKPYYISEFGPDGPWESRYTAWRAPIEQTSAKKAEQTETRYHIITGNNDDTILGSLFFIWGNKYEGTHTWFSLFKDGYKSEILMEVERLWKESNKLPGFVGLEYMLVEGKGAADNLVFNPVELKNAELKLNVHGNDSIRVKWEIYPDVWYQGWNEEKYNTKKLNPPTPVDCFISSEKNTATFITPEKEGPYRIFAYVFNKDGYFATTNTPFYVLKNK